MVRIIFSIIVFILVIWLIVALYHMWKANRIERDLEESKIEERRLQIRATTLKTDIKNKGVDVALSVIEDELKEGEFDTSRLWGDVEEYVQPDSFKGDSEKK